MTDYLGIYQKLLDSMYNNTAPDFVRDSSRELLRIYDNIWKPVCSSIGTPILDWKKEALEGRKGKTYKFKGFELLL